MNVTSSLSRLNLETILISLDRGRFVHRESKKVHTLSMLLHYLGKLENQKYAVCMHVKHVSSAIFYNLSNRYLPNVMKIRAKISTMQNIIILLFVRVLSLTN